MYICDVVMILFNYCYRTNIKYILYVFSYTVLSYFVSTATPQRQRQSKSKSATYSMQYAVCSMQYAV